ncbi:sigma-70 family RNA polymerase sigma factor [Gaiella sp.]|uniref:sigma-70 family RNA polymerase sigma factor n=1 Tax=Gaiella sp. TaxID=2663207 RepID=UPI003983279E
MEALTASTPAALSPSPVALRLLSDERLARWAANGSQAAFAVIFERHHQALHRYCQSIVGNSHDAADALQNTMLKALRALPGETRTIALKPWLYRIAHNEAISLMRARRPDSALDAATELGGPAAHTIAESRERLRDLTADLRELTEQQRGTLLMRELAGLEFDDISAALQISATAAKQSVYEARCALQSLGEGRAMDCDLVRRTLSEGDRRTLRNMRIRGHLRDCAGCRDFETALRQRPAQLAALSPPLPLAAAAAILQGLLGSGSGAGGSGGGLLAGLGLGAKSSGALSVGVAKIASVAVIAGSSAAGAIIIASQQPALRADAAPLMRQSAPALTQAVSSRATRERSDKPPARRAPRKARTPTSALERGDSTSTDKPPATEPQRPGAESAPLPVSPTDRPSLPQGATAPAGSAAPGPAAAADRRPTPPPATTTATAPAAAGYSPPARPAAGAAPYTTPAAAPPSTGAPILPAAVPERAAAPAGSTGAPVAPRPR